MSITSVIRYIEALDTSSTTGVGKTGLAFGDITAKYVVKGGTLTSLTTETITTLGTYQAPTSDAHIRIKELNSADPTKGIYEVHFHNTQVTSSGVKLWLFLTATGAKFQPLEIDLNDVSGRIPSALGSNGNLKADVRDLLDTAWLTPAVAGTPDVNIKLLGNSQQSVTDLKDFADTGYDPSSHKVTGVVLVDTLTTYTNNTPQTGDSFSLIGTNGSNLTALATSAQINALAVNTRANLSVPVEIENPDSSTQVYKIRLNLFDVEGNMEAPDSTPTIALTNAAGTDRSSRLSIASNPSTGVYTWNYTATVGDTEEQLIWVFTVVEGGLTRTYSSTSYVVEESAYRFSSSDRSNLTAIFNKLPTNNIADQTDMLAEFSLLPTASEIVAFMDANSITLSNISNAIANLNDVSISEIGNVVDTSLATYDGPTNAEMIARTLVSASYATAANQTTIMNKTNLIPASPASIGSAMTLADGSITDATITLPTEATGTPSTFLQLMMWLAGCFGWRKFVKDSNTNTMTQYMSNGTTVKTTSTYTSAAGIDTINKAS